MKDFCFLWRIRRNTKSGGADKTRAFGGWKATWPKGLAASEDRFYIRSFKAVAGVRLPLGPPKSGRLAQRWSARFTSVRP